jgi:replicative DNA helicase
VQYRFNLDKSIYHVEDKVIAEMNSDVKSNLFIFNKIEIPTLNFLKQIIEKAKDNVDMIIIDHLHYIYLERDEELRQIGEIMRTLKTISDIIKKPIILISHLRKKTNNTKEREPSIDDLYGSSNIGKEATTVLLLNKMRVADARSLNNELPIEDIDKRYC